jgi:hypothetical protein
MSELSRKKRLLFIGILVAGPYLIAEAVASTYGWFSGYDHSFIIVEDRRETVSLDLVRGAWLPSVPVRSACVANGKLEWVGLLHGNAQGFPSWHDYTPKRSKPLVKRIAVFGDSMTQEHFLGRSWPERAQELTECQDEPVEFLNFSLWGSGLTNWWSIITKILEKEDYEIDGVVFAVTEDSLLRSLTLFTVVDSADSQRKLLLTRWPSFDPRSLPSTEFEVRRAIQDKGDSRASVYWMVPSAEFDRVLQGEWPAQVPHRFRLALATSLYRSARTLLLPLPREPSEGIDLFASGRKGLIDDMGSYVERRRLPVLVVQIPGRRTALKERAPTMVHLDRAKAFAQALGGAFLNGGEMFAGMSPTEIRNYYFPRDVHWNQNGSDRFADFIVKNLRIMQRPSEGKPANGTVAGS